jgi:putative nucleotidyltransferase with HDIG domain/PAS domain S-box-containing protein
MLYMLEDLNESEEMVRAAKEEWEATFDAIASPVFIHDRDGIILRANRAYAKQAGRPFRDFIGNPYWQVFPRLDAPLPVDQSSREEEKEIRAENGEIYLSHSYAMRSSRKKPCFVHFLENITQRKKAEKLIRDSRNRLRLSLEGTVQAVAKAVEARDPYTSGHQLRVASLATAMAKRMGLDQDTIDGIRLGAMIHDIGKIHLPAEILAKPSRLTDIEFEMIKGHPEVGYEILRGISFPWPVADIARQHHERMDGSGYPLGLKDGEICLEARIVAVADVVEAISSHRPYRPALGLDFAIQEISRNKGRIYCPMACEACLKVLENGFGFERI